MLELNSTMDEVLKSVRILEKAEQGTDYRKSCEETRSDMTSMIEQSSPSFARIAFLEAELENLSSLLSSKNMCSSLKESTDESPINDSSGSLVLMHEDIFVLRSHLSEKEMRISHLEKWLVHVLQKVEQVL